MQRFINDISGIPLKPGEWLLFCFDLAVNASLIGLEEKPETDEWLLNRAA